MVSEETIKESLDKTISESIGVQLKNNLLKQKKELISDFTKYIDETIDRVQKEVLYKFSSKTEFKYEDDYAIYKIKLNNKKRRKKNES